MTQSNLRHQILNQGISLAQKHVILSIIMTVFGVILWFGLEELTWYDFGYLLDYYLAYTLIFLGIFLICFIFSLGMLFAVVNINEELEDLDIKGRHFLFLGGILLPLFTFLFLPLSFIAGASSAYGWRLLAKERDHDL